MAYVSTNHTVSSPIMERATAAFASFRQSRADYRIFKTTVNELQALETRELADLGIYRGDINEIARTSVYGK